MGATNAFLFLKHEGQIFPLGSIKSILRIRAEVKDNFFINAIKNLIKFDYSLPLIFKTETKTLLI